MLWLVGLLAVLVSSEAVQVEDPLPSERPGAGIADALSWSIEARQPCGTGPVCLGARASLLNSSMTILMETACPRTPATCSAEEAVAFGAARASFDTLKAEIAAQGVPLSSDSLQESNLDELAAHRVVDGWIQAAEAKCDLSVRLCTLGRLWLLSEADQAARTVAACAADRAATGPCWTDKRAVLREIDNRASPMKHGLLDNAAWPTSDVWGTSASTAAWLLVQHSDAEPSFQRTVLSQLLEADALPRDERRHVAYLMDRIAVAESQPQWFGTQGACRGDAWEAKPVREPSGLDDRRKRLGLDSMADYAQTTASICQN